LKVKESLVEKGVDPKRIKIDQSAAVYDGEKTNTTFKFVGKKKKE